MCEMINFGWKKLLLGRKLDSRSHPSRRFVHGGYFAFVSRGADGSSQSGSRSALCLNFGVVGVCSGAGPSPTSHLAMGIFSPRY